MAIKKSDDTNKASSTNSEENPEISTNIFNKLFGETPNVEPTCSLFSTDNPFRRKLTDLSQKTPILENPNHADLKTKKRNGGQDDSLFKKGNTLKIENLEKNFDLGLNENFEKKKKRKRDELEKEYEAKKYGTLPEVEEEEKRKEKGSGRKRKTIDDPAEMVVSQEGYDDESKLLRTIFVGNLPLKIKRKVLTKEFNKFGDIESVRIRSVPTLDGKKPKKVQIFSGKINEALDSVNAYIVFRTEQGAEASLVHNMSMVGGNHIRVDRACPPRKKLKGDEASASLYSNKRTVFVGNLPFDVKDEELYQLFCSIKQLESSVEAVRVIRDRQSGLGKGIAYVLFKTREAANFLCRKHNIKLRDRELRICHAKSSTQSTTPSKRKRTPSQGDSESSPAKKLSTPESSSRYKVSAGGNTSYQGIRASKSGEKKKTPQRRMGTPATSTPKSSGTKRSGNKIKERTEKRPAVAARKAKEKMQSGGVPKHAGNKRKMNVRTPQSSSNNKKFKKSK
ncbi:nucleolar protein 12 [Amaranthus tricolor]|uniref:nucleolar protein 12 n=1 Tax=Amaranthus tricolor TaxID=29722 RepID=UPI002582B428|nr:nucleolar protein 12 [Amaranthus tricolor]